jgi:copper(I)-binding protein
MRLSLALAAALAAAAPAAPDTRATGGITVTDAIAFETAPTAMAGGGYMTITNGGPEPDRLVGVRANFPRVELHETVETDGVARMQKVASIEVPPGESAALRPGGRHVMFMGLGGDPFEQGETVPVTLVFERAGEVEVVLTVVARDAPAHDMPETDAPTK